MSQVTERVARAICGHTRGFCDDVGGDLGCKVGRGETYNGANCVATADQLMLCGHMRTAEAAISAAEAPSELSAAITRVYQNLLWRHLDAARKDFDGPARKKVFGLIEAYREQFPEECNAYEANPA